MLVIDRNVIPTIPRPVYEFLAELVDDEQVRVSVMAGNDAGTRWTELNHTPAETLAHRVAYWLRGTGYFDRHDAVWSAVIAEVADRVAAWVKRGIK